MSLGGSWMPNNREAKQRAIDARATRVPDLTGRHLGHCRVLGRAEPRGSHKSFWECACTAGGNCGIIFEASSQEIMLGTKPRIGCGCMAKPMSKRRPAAPTPQFIVPYSRRGLSL